MQILYNTEAFVSLSNVLLYIFTNVFSNTPVAPITTETTSSFLLHILWHIIIIIIIIIIIGGGFVSDFQVFAFYHVLSSVIPTPWTHMVVDVLSCYLIWFYWQYLPEDMCSS